jgi:BNR repeat protein
MKKFVKRKRVIRIIKLLMLLFSLAHICTAQSPDIKNNYSSDKNIPHLSIERSMIYVPEKDWLYAHHASITHFKNIFIAFWSNGMMDEDAPGQRVVFSTSTDFVHWSAPAIVASPAVYKADTLNVLTAAGFHQYHDTLVAYYGEYSPHRTNTHLWAKTTTDGEHWSDAIDMHVPVNPNHGPQAIANGRLIISGNFSFPYTDDPSGLSGWTMSSFYDSSLYKEDNPATFYAPAEKMHLPPLCEGSFFQTNNGLIYMLLRVTGKGWKGRLWMTVSKDNGADWSLPAETSFTDNDSKFHFGKLPDGRFYYVGIPDTLHHYARTPLVLAVSADGRFFNKQYIIADGNPYILKSEGLWKGGQYGYPHSLIYNGYVYVIISRQKEAIEVLRFRLDGL